MLGKLMKRDFALTYRSFLGLFLAIALATIFMTVSLMGDLNSSLLFGLSVLAVLAVGIAAVVISILCQFQLFNQNIYSAEGYLTMALPVKAETLILSKLLVGSLWILAVHVVAFICGFISFRIMFPEMNFSFFIERLELLMGATINPSVYTTGLLLLFMTFFTYVVTIMQINLCCALAHLQLFNRFRIVAGIGSFFLIQFLMSKLFDLITSNSLFHLNLETIPYFTDAVQEDICRTTNGFIGISFLYNLAFLLIFYFGTVYLVKRHLELD